MGRQGRPGTVFPEGSASSGRNTGSKSRSHPLPERLPGAKLHQADERISTSYENRSRHPLTPGIAPMGLHKFCFTVSDTLVGVNANTSDTCTLYKYASKEQMDF